MHYRIRELETGTYLYEERCGCAAEVEAGRTYPARACNAHLGSKIYKQFAWRAEQAVSQRVRMLDRIALALGHKPVSPGRVRVT